MKRVIVIIVALTFLGISCKKKKVEALTPIKEDTPSIANYEFMDTNEIGDDTVVVANKKVDTDTTKIIEIVSEDTTGKISTATNKQINTADYIYVIVGSYTKLENATKRKIYFNKLGYKSEVLPKYGNYNRVTIARFESETEARTKLREYRKKFNDKSYWLLIR